MYVVGIVLFGGLAGYILSLQGARTATTTPATPVPASAAGAASGPNAVVDDAQLRAYRDILTRDPNNLQAAVAAGNMLYDAQRYADAIAFYQKAVAIAPSDVNVSTDLGTALWYSGHPDEALAQFDKSLAVDPTHAQTLFNAGIVRADGKRDYAGAVGAWEKLLASNPAYENAARVRQLITSAKSKIQG